MRYEIDMRYKMRCRFAAIENNVHIGFSQQVYKLEFVGLIPSPGGKVPRRGG